MGKQTELLDLQAIDSRMDQLKRQRAEIPERAQADDLAADVARVAALMTQAEERLHGAEREQAKLDSEDATLTEKIEREEKKLYSGSVVNPKELGSIQEEVSLLRKHRDELETTLLDAMEEVETGRRQVGEIEQRKNEMEHSLAALEEAFSMKAKELDDAISVQEQARVEAAACVADELLATYEKVRQQKGGVAVGQLEDDVCGACRVELPAQELERMRGGEGIWRCPQCRRILVERRQ